MEGQERAIIVCVSVEKKRKNDSDNQAKGGKEVGVVVVVDKKNG